MGFPTKNKGDNDNVKNLNWISNKTSLNFIINSKIKLLIFYNSIPKMKGKKMEDKGVLTGLATVITYPVTTLVGLLLSIIMYPISVIVMLFDPNTP